MNSRIEGPRDNHPIQCTVSIGLTSLREGDVALESMIRRADKALYNAKRTGAQPCRAGVNAVNHV